MARRKTKETENITDYIVELSFSLSKEIMFIKINGEVVDFAPTGQKVKILIGRKVAKKPVYAKLE